MDELKKLLENAGVAEVRSDPMQFKSYEAEDENGNTYRINFEYRGDDETMFVEANGISVAMATLSEHGTESANISKPELLIDAILAFAEAIR